MNENKKNCFSQVSILAIFTMGCLIMLYPFYVDALNNVIDQYRFEKYLKEEKQLYAQQRSALLEKNQELTTAGLTPSVDPFNSNENSSITKEEYQTHLIGKINIPKLAIELPLFDTTTNAFLDIGATVLNGTSYPLGGKGTHAIISAHRGLPDKELFTNLPDLNNGDIFLLEVFGETLAYQVFESKIVRPEETSVLKIEPTEDLVTLLTCTPYMINSHRLLVTGKRIPYSKKAKALQKIGNQVRTVKYWGILFGMIVFLSIVGYKGYRLIYGYFLQQHCFDFSFFIQSSPQLSTLELYDKKGRKKIKRSNHFYSVSPDENGKVILKNLPRNQYMVKANHTWLIKFGVKKKHERPKIYKQNKKRIAFIEEKENIPSLKFL